MAKLIINPTSSSRREVPLARTLLSIGRDPSNDVVLPDALVSRRHAVIECRNNQYFLRDCNSSNGSLVNGDRVSEQALKDGDLLAIGTARLLFRELAETAEDSAPKVVPHPSAPPRLSCPSCRADYKKGDLFCRQCGKALPPPAPVQVNCSGCGAVVQLPAKFCNACGAALPRDEATQPRNVPGSSPPPPTPGLAEPAAGAAAGAGMLPPTVAPSISDAGSGSPQPDPALGVPPKDNPPRGDAIADIELRDVPAPAVAGSPRPIPKSSPRPVPAPFRVPLREAPPVAAPRPSARLAPSPAPRAPDLPRASAAVSSSATPAGFGIRLVAGIVDSAIVGLSQAVLVSPALFFFYRWFDAVRTAPEEPGFLPILLSVALVTVSVLLGAGYYVYFWGVRGATPGKRMVGLVVQGADGTMPIGVGRALLRLLGYMLSSALLGIGFLMIAFGGDGLHDRLASTRVVRK